MFVFYFRRYFDFFFDCYRFFVCFSLVLRSFLFGLRFYRAFGRVLFVRVVFAVGVAFAFAFAGSLGEFRLRGAFRRVVFY